MKKGTHPFTAVHRTGRQLAGACDGLVGPRKQPGWKDATARSILLPRGRQRSFGCRETQPLVTVREDAVVAAPLAAPLAAGAVTTRAALICGASMAVVVPPFLLQWWHQVEEATEGGLPPAAPQSADRMRRLDGSSTGDGAGSWGRTPPRHPPISPAVAAAAGAAAAAVARR